MAIRSFQKKIAYVALAIILLVYLIIESSGQNDFFIFLSASNDLFTGENIYLKCYLDGFHYFYSVMFAIVIYPLTLIPLHLATFLWLSLNALLLWRLYYLLSFFLSLYELNTKQKKLFWILSLLFSSRLILDNFHLAQMTTFILFLCMEGIYRIQQDKKWTGALLIAIGINIKLLPVVLVPYLLYRKEFKASALIILFYAILMYLPVLFIGSEQNNLLLASWAGLVNPLNSNHILDVAERSFHSLTTLLSTLLVEKVPDTYALPIKRNIANISLEQLAKVIMITRLAFAAFTLYFMRTLPFKPAINKNYQYRELSYILLIIPLIFPHQQHYAFLFIVPAYLYCLYYIIRYYTVIPALKRKILISAMALIYIVVNLKLLLGEYNYYYEHFKILTYGALLLIVVLAVLKPKPSTETK